MNHTHCILNFFMCKCIELFLLSSILCFVFTKQYPTSETITVKRIVYPTNDLNQDSRNETVENSTHHKLEKTKTKERVEVKESKAKYSHLNSNKINGLSSLHKQNINYRVENIPGKWNKNHLTYTILNFAVGLKRQQQRIIFSRAFSYWSEVSPLTFREVYSRKADIRILFADGYHYVIKSGYPCTDPFDGPQRSSRTRTGNKIAHAFQPPAGEIHFDASENWTDGSYDGINLASIATHEIGHALGLHHSHVKGSIMRSFFQGYDPDLSLGADDVWQIQALYGENLNKKKSSAITYPRAPHPPSTKNTPLPDICSINFDAMFQGPDMYIYIFKHKWLWKLDANGVYPGYPRLTRDVYEDAPINPGAVVYSPKTGYTYMFYTNYVLQYMGHVLYRRKFTTRDIYGSPDAAVTGFSGEIYILKGRFYWIFDEKLLDVTTRYKRRIRDNWPGIPGNIDAAMTYNEYHVQFFTGSKYWDYDMIYKKTDRDSPKEKSHGWMGINCTSS